MVIHPTRTNLLLCRERLGSVMSSITILKARRKALIREFLSTTMPFLRAREDIRKTYGKALVELAVSKGREGEEFIRSLAQGMEEDLRIEVIEKNLWGLKYRDVLFSKSPVRPPDRRGYDFSSTTPHLEEGIYLFEKTVEYLFQIASFESKLKRLGEEITRLTRKIKVLEERVLPNLKTRIRAIAASLGEREREVHFRLKRFKALSGRVVRAGKSPRSGTPSVLFQDSVMNGRFSAMKPEERIS